MKRGSDRDTPGIAERRQLSTVTPRGGGLSERIFLSGNGPCPARTDKALFRTSSPRDEVLCGPRASASVIERRFFPRVLRA